MLQGLHEREITGYEPLVPRKILATTENSKVEVGREESELFIDNQLVRIHLIIETTGLAPWKFEFPFPGSLTSTFLGGPRTLKILATTESS